MPKGRDTESNKVTMNSMWIPFPWDGVSVVATLVQRCFNP